MRENSKQLLDVGHFITVPCVPPCTCKIKAPADVLPGLRLLSYQQSGLSVIHKLVKGRTAKRTVNNNDRADNNADNNNGGCRITHQTGSFCLLREL